MDLEVDAFELMMKAVYWYVLQLFLLKLNISTHGWSYIVRNVPSSTPPTKLKLWMPIYQYPQLSPLERLSSALPLPIAYQNPQCQKQRHAPSILSYFCRGIPVLNLKCQHSLEWSSAYLAITVTLAVTLIVSVTPPLHPPHSSCSCPQA